MGTDSCSSVTPHRCGCSTSTRIGFLAVNAAALAEYGYPPEKFLSLTIRDVYGEADLARFDQGLASDAQELYTGSWFHRRHDGTTLQVEIRSSDLSFQDRRARLIHVTNVTARLQAEAARRESEQLLGAIVESSDDAILSETPDGRILTWNAAAERMYGYTASEAIGASDRADRPARGSRRADGQPSDCLRWRPHRTVRNDARFTKTGAGSWCRPRFHPS